MTQPGLCAQTVIKLSEGPASVTDFEAKPSVDDLRQRQVLNYYSPGISKETKLLACQRSSCTTVVGYLR